MFIVNNMTTSTVEIRDFVPEIHIKPGQEVDLNYWFSTKELNDSEQLKDFLKHGFLKATDGIIELDAAQALVFLSQNENMLDPMFNLDIARIKIKDEFENKIIDLNRWGYTKSGTGGKVQIFSGGIGGQLLIRSGKSAGRTVTLHTNGKTYFRHDDVVIRARYRIEHINNSYSEIGLSNDNGQIRFERNGVGNWYGVCENNGNVTNVDTGVVTTQNFHWFGIVGHHPDYNQPLNVIWCCKHCHPSLHSKGLGNSFNRERIIRSLTKLNKSFKKRLFSSSVQKPIVGSTMARLYQLRSKSTISPPDGRC